MRKPGWLYKACGPREEIRALEGEMGRGHLLSPKTRLEGFGKYQTVKIRYV